MADQTALHTSLDVLQQQTRDMEQKMAIFVESRSTKLKETTIKHVEYLQENKENAQAIQAKISQAREDAKRKHVVHEQREAELSEVQKQIEETNAHATKAAEEARTADAMLAALQEKKWMLAEAKATLSAQASQKSSKLAAGLELYTRWLGLEFARRDGEKLQLIFTRIDAEDPARKFHFTVHVDEENKYQITECVPAVETMPEMLARLQESNDFGTFVREMRAQFKAMC